MRILYISNSIIPSRTANSIHVMKMCQAFADNGHNVILLAPDIKKGYEKNTGNIYKYYGVKKNFIINKLWCPNIKGNFIFFTFSIFLYLLVNKHFHLVYGRFLHGCYVAALLKKNVILELHDNIFNKKKHIVIIFKRLIKSKFLKKVVVISKALKKIYLKNKYLNKDNIQVAHDGADEVKKFKCDLKLKGRKRSLKLGYVGHLYKGKGMEIISKIANKLDKDIEIHIVGGIEKDIKFWKNQISSKNIYFYGFIPHNKTSNYIKALDVCLLPNQKIVHPHGADPSDITVNISSFTSPLKLFEYMAHKKPIIASDLPVLREVLNKKNSILVSCDDLEKWIEAINKLKDLKKRKQIATKALKDFSKYSWKNRALLIIGS